MAQQSEVSSNERMQDALRHYIIKERGSSHTIVRMLILALVERSSLSGTDGLDGDVLADILSQLH